MKDCVDYTFDDWHNSPLLDRRRSLESIGIDTLCM